jgi:hypothetical protein
VIQLKKFRWAGHIARIEEMRNEYEILVGQHEKKRPLVRPRHRWEDNIKVDLKGTGSQKAWARLNRFRTLFSGEPL